MEYGVFIFPTVDAMPPGELARTVEERGFESLWVAEHTHIPASRHSPYPGGGDLPDMYYEAMDPFVVLTAAAATTTKLKIATGICLVIQRDPIVTAKQVASLDQVSNGRFLFGVGAGWNAEEMANHGTSFQGRFKLMRERIEAMKAIWAEEPAEYHGDLVDFDPIHARPKPVQTPHPPIHVGGAPPHGAMRAARYGDGWIPIGGRGGDPVDNIGVLAQECAKVGRNPSEIEISSYSSPTDHNALARMRDAGIHRAVFGLPPAGADALLPILDDLAVLAAAVG